MATISSISKESFSVGQQITIEGSSFSPNGSTPVVLFDGQNVNGSVFYYTDSIIEMIIPNLPAKKYTISVSGSAPVYGTILESYEEPKSNLPTDFKIINVNGLFEYSFEGTDGIENNVILSLSIPKGSWWFNPNFGHELDSIKKVTTDVGQKVETAVKNCLQWLVDLRKVNDISVVCKYDHERKRIQSQISLKDRTGAEFRFTRFISVY